MNFWKGLSFLFFVWQEEEVNKRLENIIIKIKGIKYLSWLRVCFHKGKTEQEA